MAMIYPDSKHNNPLRLGELYQELINYLLEMKLGWRVSFTQSEQRQYSIGESWEGVEIKLDYWCTQTRRLSLEVGEKRHSEQPHFTPSGIFRRDNCEYYIQGNLIRAWIFKKYDLTEYYKKHKPDLISNDPPTIQKFYISIRDSEEIAKATIPVTPYTCQKAFELPLPQITNCAGCKYSDDGHCVSRGAKLFREITEELLNNGRKETK